MREVVLYVEDHPVNVLLMQTVFELRPELELVVAVDGTSAMAATACLQPALLLLDLRLPDCHGTEFLAQAAARADTADAAGPGHRAEGRAPRPARGRCRARAVGVRAHVVRRLIGRRLAADWSREPAAGLSRRSAWRARADRPA
jgi:CheY-like chemotaxis protein